MSCPEPEQIDAAPPPPGCTTPPQVESNGGAAHAESDAERMETASEGDVEKEFEESTGKMHKKRKFAPPHEYRLIEEWVLGPDSVMEPAEIDHEIKKHLKKFMQDSRLMIAPGKDSEKKKTEIALWKQQRKPYLNSRTNEWVHMFMCPMIHRCKCAAKARICT